MTILATHFSIVLGAWRLRIRVDIDEPRASEIDEPVRAVAQPPGGWTHGPEPHVTARGRG